jgi:hypothetical protein
MWAWNREGIGLSYRPARLPAGGIDPLEWIPGLLKRLIPSQIVQHLPCHSLTLSSSCVAGRRLSFLPDRGRGRRTIKTLRRDLVHSFLSIILLLLTGSILYMYEYLCETHLSLTLGKTTKARVAATRKICDILAKMHGLSLKRNITFFH